MQLLDAIDVTTFNKETLDGIGSRLSNNISSQYYSEFEYFVKIKFEVESGWTLVSQSLAPKLVDMYKLDFDYCLRSAEKRVSDNVDASTGRLVFRNINDFEIVRESNGKIYGHGELEVRVRFDNKAA